MRVPAFRPVTALALCSLLLAPLPARAQTTAPPELVATENPQPQALSFSPALSRVKYRQALRNVEFTRPAGSPKGTVQESSIRQEFQVSVWEVPSGSGVLRVETQPLRVGAKVKDQVTATRLRDFPVSVTYMRRDGRPCAYSGTPMDDQVPTALVLPDRPVRPGDVWKRSVAPSPEFELPTEVTFTYVREGRLHGRLCAEIAMEANAKGSLGHERGLATMSAKATFLVDIRLGRVIYSRSRLFQSLIGQAREGIPPAKRKLEQTIELWGLI